MTELTNGSHGDENYRDEIDPSNESHVAARNSILDKLKGGNHALREAAKTSLIDSDTFWDSVFSIGANTLMSNQELIKDSINIGVDVFAAVAGEVYDESVRLEIGAPS